MPDKKFMQKAVVVFNHFLQEFLLSNVFSKTSKILQWFFETFSSPFRFCIVPNRLKRHKSPKTILNIHKRFSTVCDGLGWF